MVRCGNLPARTRAPRHLRSQDLKQDLKGQPLPAIGPKDSLDPDHPETVGAPSDRVAVADRAQVAAIVEAEIPEEAQAEGRDQEVEVEEGS